MATEIADMSDDELRQQLIEYGVNVGPIVSSTRLFYEKKLAKVIDSGGVQPAQAETEESEEEDEEEEEEEEEEVQFNFKQKQQQQPPQSAPRPTDRPQYTSTPITQSQTYTPVTKARVATPTTATRRNVPGRLDDRPTTASKPKAQESQSQRGGISMWIKLLFVIFVAFLVYLVIINMNPSAENKIPLTFEEPV